MRNGCAFAGEGSDEFLATQATEGCCSPLGCDRITAVASLDDPYRTKKLRTCAIGHTRPIAIMMAKSPASFEKLSRTWFSYSRSRLNDKPVLSAPAELLL